MSEGRAALQMVLHLFGIKSEYTAAAIEHLLRDEGYKLVPLNRAEELQEQKNAEAYRERKHSARR
jgi:hypothetical protein